MEYPGSQQRVSQPAISVEVPRVLGRRQLVSICAQHRVPETKITTLEHMLEWKHSEAYLRLVEFIMALNVACKGVKLGTGCHLSKPVLDTVRMLELLDDCIEVVPLEEGSPRYGNPAFRTWLAMVNDKSTDLHQYLPQKAHAYIPELVLYLCASFGNAVRIDYGSGHELSFVSWLNCLELLGVFDAQDYTALVTRVFATYMKLVRHLQQHFKLEPAGNRLFRLGSHGVWGLDDYQFLTYYWGSSQLVDHPNIKPKSITNKEIVEHYAADYLYMGCILYINTVKTGPFHEHSPILYDISGVLLWSKVNSGMLKMYLVEVLQKLPVMQHFLFGSLLPFHKADELIFP